MTATEVIRRCGATISNSATYATAWRGRRTVSKNDDDVEVRPMRVDELGKTVDDVTKINEAATRKIFYLLC